MTENNIELLTGKFRGAISGRQAEELKRGLETLPDEKYGELNGVKTKSALVTVLLSAFLGLFGAGSFYLGCFKRGLVKICFNVIIPVACGLISLLWLSPMFYSYHTDAVTVVAAVSLVNGELKPCLDEYSAAYKSLNEQLENIEKKNDELKSVLAFATDGQLEAKMNFMLDCLNGAFGKELLTDLTELMRLNGLISAENYEKLTNNLDKAAQLLAEAENGEAVENINALKQRLAVLTDTMAIDNAVTAVKAINGLSLKSTTEELRQYTEIADDFLTQTKTDRKSEALSAAVTAVTENPLTEKLQTETGGAEANLKPIAENFATLLSDMKAEYLALTGAEFNTEAKEPLTFAAILNSVKASLNDIDNAELVGEITSTLSGLNPSANSASLLESSITSIENYRESAQADSENSVNAFAEELYSQTGKASKALKAISYKSVGGEEDGYLQTIAHSIAIMSEQKQAYVSVEARIEEANKNLDVAKHVDKKLKMHKTLDAVLYSIDYVKTETDIDKVMDELDDKIGTLSGLEENASYWEQEWKTDSTIIRLLFIILLSIDGAVILAYWIGEVFGDREKCLNINYEKIVKTLGT